MRSYKHRQPAASSSQLMSTPPGVFPGPLAGFIALAIFIGVVEVVLRTDYVTAWDIRALHWLQSGNSPLGIEVFTAISLLGSPQFIAYLGLIVSVFLIWKRQWNYLAGWCLALIGGEVLESLLKFLIQRPRPEFSNPLWTHSTYSLPSGHAMTSLIAYSMLSYILVSVWKRDRAAQFGILTTAALLIVGIGFSRLYLGVHYVSDIVAGFAAGTFWISLCISVTTLLQSRLGADSESKG